MGTTTRRRERTSRHHFESHEAVLSNNTQARGPVAFSKRIRSPVLATLAPHIS